MLNIIVYYKQKSYPMLPIGELALGNLSPSRVSELIPILRYHDLYIMSRLLLGLKEEVFTCRSGFVLITL